MQMVALFSFNLLENRKHKILTRPIVWNPFIIRYIEAPKIFAVFRTLLHGQGNNAARLNDLDSRSTLM